MYSRAEDVNQKVSPYGHHHKVKYLKCVQFPDRKKTIRLPEPLFALLSKRCLFQVPKIVETLLSDYLDCKCTNLYNFIDVDKSPMYAV